MQVVEEEEVILLVQRLQLVVVVPVGEGSHLDLLEHMQLVVEEEDQELTPSATADKVVPES
jgi:hypothetical protein